MSIQSYIQRIDEVLGDAIDNGVDHELLLAMVLSQHTLSDESDKCHIYGITFAEKMDRVTEMLLDDDDGSSVH